MVYRIILDAFFIDIDPMNDILEEVKRRFPEAITINPGQPNEQPSYWDSHECYHDTPEGPPCKVLEHGESP